MINVMIDLETYSTRPNAAIASIGAVKFEDDHIIDTFYCTIAPASCKEAGLHFEKSTLEWWSKQSKEARDALLKDNLLLEEALTNFEAWYGSKSLPTWGNGAAFDNVIMESAYRALDRKRPWLPWEDRCYRTMKNLVNIPIDKREGTYHNALDDALTQTKHLQKILGS
jgi:DNA polymerase III epsilon subunit-like protein